MTQLYTGAVGNTYVYLTVDGGASTTPYQAGIDGAYGSGNNSYYPMTWDVDFTCSPSASSTIYVHEMTAGTVMAFSPNVNSYSGELGMWLSTQCLTYATNTRYIDVTLWGDAPTASPAGDTSTTTVTVTVFTDEEREIITTSLLIMLWFLVLGAIYKLTTSI